jgi:hypothetical protein
MVSDHWTSPIPSAEKERIHQHNAINFGGELRRKGVRDHQAKSSPTPLIRL